MRLFNRSRETALVPRGTKQVTLKEAFDTYDYIGLSNDGRTMLMAERGIQLASPGVSTPQFPRYGEIGTSAPGYVSFAREDYNPDLRGWLGLRAFDKMRRNDGQVSGTLRLVKTPVLGARWYMEPASDSKKDKKIAQFVWNNLTKWMTMSWPQMLQEALLMLDFGYYMFEKVFDFKEIDGQMRVVWRKFGPRHPLDVVSWDTDYHGGPQGVEMYGPGISAESVYIPISKLCVFTYQLEGGNMEGISVLRPAYKHWYYKDQLYKIDAIQKERHGIGIPIIKLPANFTPTDRSIAEELGRNLRTNEKAHVVLPPNWDIIFAKIEGQTVDCLKSIEHHDLLISRNVLGQFISSGVGHVGTSQNEQLDTFLKSTRYIADTIRDVFNKWAIPELVNYNWANVQEYPELRVRRIGDTQDWRVISFAIRNLIGAGVMQADDPLEDWVRDEMDLPKLDKDSIREVATPQAPRVGAPRQSTAPGMNNSPGAGNRTADKSGVSGTK